MHRHSTKEYQMTATLTDPATSSIGGDVLTLRPYQNDAVEFLHKHNRAGLFLDMGL